MSIKEPTFEEMKEDIVKAGGLFYQYRPCRRDAETIYDIENIRHGVVYAQTPLNMNDPFDSVAGFSTEKIYDDCIALLMDAVNTDDDFLKVIMKELLRNRMLGQTTELIVNLNDIKKYIVSKRTAMHQTKLPYNLFIRKNVKNLYSKCPKAIKEKFDKYTFLFLAMLANHFEEIDITEENLSDVLHCDDLLEELRSKIEAIKEDDYLKNYNEFLSQVTVSCFSSSGWDNQLMWSHYANSYSGICIEYDFRDIKDFNGFIYPIRYSKQRPALTMKDLGVEKYDNDSNSIKHCEVDTNAILSYLLVKNECWEYEKEWRIINIGEPFTPKFIELPHIKSITIGQRIDPITKLFLLDICKEKEITCYNLVVDTEKFQITRKEILDSDISFDASELDNYLDILIKQITATSQKMEVAGEKIQEEIQDNNAKGLATMLIDIIDFLSNSYYLKQTLNRILDNSDEDLSEIQLEQEILNNLKEIDNAVSLVKESATELNNNIYYLEFGGALSRTDYIKCKKHLSDILELIDKYFDLKWHNFLNVLNEDIK